MFQKLLYCSALFLLLHSCAVKKQNITEQDWYAYTKNKSERLNPANVYEFSEGMIRMHGANIGYLMTNTSYKNFELNFEFRWNIDEKYTQGKGKKNSGLMYNIPVDSPDHIWPKGIQFQIKEESTGDFIFLDNVTAVVNGKLIEAGPSVNSFKFLENEKPYGEWNTVLIRSFDGKITHYLNGKLVNECREASSREGKISLNYEGAPIDFRNIQITKIHKE